jgi:putative membrane protein (TIGR04086 family)
MSTRAQHNETPGVGRSIRPIAVSVAAGILFSILLLFLMSVVVATQNIPQAAIEPMALFAASAGAFAAGYLCAKAMGANGLLYGAISGAGILLVVLIAGAATGSGGLGIPALVRALFILLSAMIGGVIRVNTGRRRR